MNCRILSKRIKYLPIIIATLCTGKPWFIMTYSDLFPNEYFLWSLFLCNACSPGIFEVCCKTTISDSRSLPPKHTQTKRSLLFVRVVCENELLSHSIVHLFVEDKSYCSVAFSRPNRKIHHKMKKLSLVNFVVVTPTTSICFLFFPEMFLLSMTIFYLSQGS